MKMIPSNRARSHADFDRTPLRMWTNHHAVIALLPAAQHFQYLNCLPNPFCSDGLDEARGSDPDAGVRYLQHQFEVQAETMRRKSISEDLIRRELRCMQSALQARFINLVKQPER